MIWWPRPEYKKCVQILSNQSYPQVDATASHQEYIMKRSLITLVLAIAALAIPTAMGGLVYTTLAGGVAEAAETSTMEAYRASESSLDQMVWTAANLNCEYAPADQVEMCERSKVSARTEMGLR